MKAPINIRFAVLSVCAALPAAGLPAQSPSPSPAAAATPSVSAPAGTPDTSAAGPKPGHGGHEGRHPGWAALTPEERAKLKAAHDAALNDPAVKAAEPTRRTDRHGYVQTVRAAMLRADPSVAPLIEKMREARHGKDAAAE